MSFAIGGLDDDDFYEDDIEFCAYPSRVKVWVFFLEFQVFESKVEKAHR